MPLVVIPYKRIWRLRHYVERAAVHAPENRPRGNLLQERRSHSDGGLWSLIKRGIGGSFTMLTGSLAELFERILIPVQPQVRMKLAVQIDFGAGFEVSVPWTG